MTTLANPSRLDRKAWGVLALTLVFWVADGYDTFVLLITARPTLTELLPHDQLPHLTTYQGYLVAITLAGWATGGIVGGVLGDRLGRRRTMIVAVAVYSVFTACSALSGNWWIFGLTRFLTGLGIGAEWGVGTSLLQEVWPERWRARGAGLLQAGFSVGGVLVSGLWVLLGSTLGLSWRWMYLFGVIPLVVVLLVRRSIPESPRWAAQRKRKVGLGELLAPGVRRNFLGALAVSIAITGGWWAVSSFLPSFVGGLVDDPKRVAFYTGWAGALYNLGEIAGCVLLGFLAESWGRKLSIQVYFAGCVAIVPIVFLLVHDAATATWLQLVAGFLTGGVYSWYTVHTPELFSTSIRATAISVVFSGSRYLAMAGAVLIGPLASAVGGFGHAAAIFAPIYLLGMLAVLFLPETKGKPLPD
ncbi:MFS transporter [Amycolatopsis sp. NPDC051372]|uniref:MFS transporter n=1 Tax=unclassified Amycolatopsis TaxID=2618356 RepID=UPI00342B9026